MSMIRSFLWILIFTIPCILSGEQIKFLTPVEIDFGDIPEGKVLEGVIQFVNTGKEPIVIRDLRVSCGCTAVESAKKNYAPGDTASVSYKLNTRGFRGKVQKSITIEFENSDIPVKSILLRVNCITYLESYPNYVTFTQIHVNSDTAIQKEVVLTNHYHEPINLKPIETDIELLTVSVSRNSIPSGENAVLYLSLKPNIPIRKSSRLIIATDEPDIETIRLPVYINILE